MNDFFSKSTTISIIAIFGFLLFYETTIFGKLLVPLYEQLMLGQPIPSIHQTAIPWALIKILLLTLITSWFFLNFRTSPVRKNALTEGLNFGAMFGILLGAMRVYSHDYLSQELSIIWFVAGIGEGMGIGLILGLVAHGKKFWN